MNENEQQHLIFVICDSIFNSVFKSQVLTPLLQRLESNQNLHITLVSFEGSKPDSKKMIKIIPAHDRLHFVLGRRFPYVGKMSLLSPVHQLSRVLELLPAGNIIARGPIAGYVALKAVARSVCTKNADSKHFSVTVQARGLCAEEYRYAHQSSSFSFFKKLLFGYFYRSLANLEKTVFGAQNNTAQLVSLEAVSPALKNYLVDTFHADPSCIEIAAHDLPAHIPQEQVVKWHKEIRQKLNIAQDATVYCYSGSYKPWQCVTETIDYFFKKFVENSSSFLLVLTTDVELFKQALAARALSQQNYAVLMVDPDDLYRYLSAADYGMLFREKDVINWVSRPTKMLEYQAVGLSVLHNNTVALLTDTYKGI